VDLVGCKWSVRAEASLVGSLRIARPGHEHSDGEACPASHALARATACICEAL